MNAELANRLAELRKQNGLSQEELASKLGLSRQAIGKWERAESSPDTDNLIRLAKLYHVSLDELLNADASAEDNVKENDDDESAIDFESNGKKVHINDNGMQIEKDNKSIHIKGIAVEKSKIDVLTEKQRSFLTSFDTLVMLVSAVSYVLLGIYMNLWHPGWLVFLLIPLYYSFVPFVTINIKPKK